MHASAVQSITIKVSEVDSALLNDADELQKMLRNVTELAGLHSLESVMHQFSPQGISAALLLSESHRDSYVAGKRRGVYSDDNL